jgi:glycosyltransferase involved in cell wall biosynthesis
MKLESYSISVVVPTYEYGGRACELLDRCLESVDAQTYRNFEVVIIDHSRDEVIERYLSKWSFPVRYRRNERGRGNSSINQNEGLNDASGEIIKILHMDDWICDPNAFEKMVAAFRLNPERSWGGFGFNHFYEDTQTTNRYIAPHIAPELRTLIGCPSVSFFINNKSDPDRFDESLIIINDSDLHFRLGKKYGPPILIEDCCVTVRMHSMQVSKNVSNERHVREIEQYRRKHFEEYQMDDLTRLANHYASDKGTIAPAVGNHGPRLHFTPVYAKFFEALRQQPITMLEIGVGSGPSLRMWYEYFPRARIHAIDVLPQSQHNNDRVTTYICDQSDRVALGRLLAQIGPLDLVIDDGSHVVMHQQTSLGVVLPHLKSGGQYWIEDLHTSDRSVWQGKTLYGYDMSIDPGESTVEVLEDFMSQGRFNSPFLTAKENQFLTNAVTSCEIFELPATHWGQNKLALLFRK